MVSFIFLQSSFALEFCWLDKKQWREIGSFPHNRVTPDDEPVELPCEETDLSGHVGESY